MVRQRLLQNQRMKIVLVTGGFDPLHSGHIAYFKSARLLGDMLIVGLNSDEWLTRKKGKSFMPWNERLCVINNLSMVDEVYTFDDEDETAKHFIYQVRAHYPEAKLIFANGGDRTADNIPEMDVNDSDIEFVFGIGGGKKLNSSSDILKRWTSFEVKRAWGSYTVLNEIPGAKVKTLVVQPGQTLSMQRHKYRSEYWMVTEGTCMINMALPGDLSNPPKILGKYDEWRVPANAWHQLANPFTKPCTIVEIQYGEKCTEDDIERLQS
jgi:D-beta-D-heptose 7-phosphate kinase/D-beta-D-heptose 1-phosphate adenosyltransferase